MQFVLAPIVILAVLALLIWSFFFRATLWHERIVRDTRKRNADFDQRLRTPGEPLRCLNCGNAFTGPIGELGCPKCSVAALVIPARQGNESERK